MLQKKPSINTCQDIGFPVELDTFSEHAFVLQNTCLPYAM